MATFQSPVLIKRYGNSRFYLAEAGRYLTVDDLGSMVEGDDDFVVRDAETGEDITSTILKQIIVERAHHG